MFRNEYGIARGSELKALTVLQPYAHWIARGQKFVENRTWGTGHQGWLAIHAGRGKRLLVASHPEQAEMAFGEIVAVAWMTRCVRIEDIANEIRRGTVPPWVLNDEHTEGPWCWLFGSVYPIDPPVRYVGRRGLYSLPTLVIYKLRENVQSAHVAPRDSTPTFARK